MHIQEGVHFCCVILSSGFGNLKYRCVISYEKHITPLYMCVYARIEFACSVGNY